MHDSSSKRLKPDPYKYSVEDHLLKQAGPFKMGWPSQNGLSTMAFFKMDQIKVYLLIGLSSFKMGWPIIKWTAFLKRAKL